VEPADVSPKINSMANPGTDPAIANNVEPVTLTLLMRHNCSLCEDMLFTLSEFSRSLNFTIMQVNIDLNPETRQKYNELVPVLKLNDQEICHHFLDLTALEKALSDVRADN